MNVFERLAVKAAWGKVKNAMKADTLKAWAPLIGGALVVGQALAKFYGRGELADMLAGVGAITGVSASSPFPVEDIAKGLGLCIPAGVWIWGAFRKVKSEVETAQLPPVAKAEVDDLKQRIAVVKLDAKEAEQVKP